ncbi:MAG: alpha/beta hydrolase [Prevotella sp.]|nr:alpha/beta hydrolase [Prevotella sp.]
MINKTVVLDVPYEKAGLDPAGCRAELDVFCQGPYGGILLNKRPAVVICPGGGYEYCSEREAEPIAVRFAAYGIQAFVLRYSCMKRFPTNLLEAARAVAYVRENAEELGVDPDKIMICGFSAGGHLAASLAVHWKKSFMTDALGGDNSLWKPNGAVLCYPVITAGEKRHDGSIANIAGDDVKLRELVSLENQVGGDVPPVFLWHTADDGCVPVENTLMFAAALAEKKIPFACHIFEKGAHGLSLCDECAASGDEHFNPDCGRWFSMAVDWIKTR